MSVLTEREVLLMRGKEQGTSKEMRAAEVKLHRFQISKINRSHVDTVNGYIEQAEAVAHEREPGVLHDSPPAQKDRWSRFFHQEMTRLTRAAGLRG